jgi:cell division protein FtsN
MRHLPCPSPFLKEGKTVGSLCSKYRCSQTGGTLLGLIFGVLVGVLISFGVVWYLNKAPLPFVEKVVKPMPKSGEADAKPIALPGKPGDKPIGEEKKFEFYEILEGKKPVGSAPGPAPVAPSAEDKKPVATGAAAMYLQVGAFQKKDDADNLRAKLAMLGHEAGVVAVEVPEKGTMHRVRLGPFSSPEEMNQKRTQLSQEGLPAKVVRGTE